MPLLDRDGVKLYYEVHGSGTPMILSHGFSANSYMWARQAALWSKQFKVIVWDMRGHGQTDYPEDQAAYSEAHTVADIAAILDETCGSGSKAVVGGLSLGGYMSQAFYKTHPERVLALLLMDCTSGIRDKSIREAWNKTATQHAEGLEQAGLSLLEFMATTPEKAKAVKHRDATGLARAARGMLAQHTDGCAAILPKIRVPTLLILGEDDAPFVQPMEYMAQNIPNAQYVVIPDAGHAVNIDKPEEVEKVVHPFLQPFSASKALL